MYGCNVFVAFNHFREDIFLYSLMLVSRKVPFKSSVLLTVIELWN